MRDDARTYINMNGTITGLEARLRYPDPKFFNRGDMRMRWQELASLVVRNADEMQHVIDMISASARGQTVGARVTKAALLQDANLLHDWRVAADIHGGTLGRPYLWEQ